MRVVFRADASNEIGTGHVLRCLTLAKALHGLGAKCIFICGEHEGHLIEKIRQEGFECKALPKSAEIHKLADADELILAHAKWLLASWQHDAQQTIHALGAEKVDWLVVDHYALDMRWEEKLRSHANKIMVIDDLADRYHDCDLLLDQNLIADCETRYQQFLPEHCATLLGPQYALLQAEYAELHPRTWPRTGPIKRILVSFGGVDKHNLTARTVSAFLRLKRDDITLDVVMSPNSLNAAESQAQAQEYANITVHDALPTLAPLMLQADLAIGASGATSWERCCLGLPSLVITLADNQKPIAAELDKRGLVRWLGHYDAVTDDNLADAMQTAIDDKTQHNWSRACMAVTDGGGVKRLVSILMLNSETKLQARLAGLDDEALLLRWANDPLVRVNSFNPEAITAENHQKWFYKRLGDTEHCKIYIVETEDGLPIGQVRFEQVEVEWEIHYSVAVHARGRDIGHKMLLAAIVKFLDLFDHVKVIAQVKSQNKASQRALEKLNFEKNQNSDKLIYKKEFLSTRYPNAD